MTIPVRYCEKLSRHGNTDYSHILILVLYYCFIFFQPTTFGPHLHPDGDGYVHPARGEFAAESDHQTTTGRVPKNTTKVVLGDRRQCTDDPAFVRVGSPLEGSVCLCNNWDWCWINEMVPLLRTTYMAWWTPSNSSSVLEITVTRIVLLRKLERMIRSLDSL